MSVTTITVTEFAALVWRNKVKAGLLALAIVSGPPLYEEWAEKRAAQEAAEAKGAVPTDASIAGMMLLSAWKSCTQIGIADVNACATYQGELLQEQAAPILAKTAVGQRDAFVKNCTRFYAYEHCRQLLDRAIRLSNAQSKE
jgi:hypothetical protein